MNIRINPKKQRQARRIVCSRSHCSFYELMREVEKLTGSLKNWKNNWFKWSKNAKKLRASKRLLKLWTRTEHLASNANDFNSLFSVHKKRIKFFSIKNKHINIYIIHRSNQPCQTQNFYTKRDPCLQYHDPAFFLLFLQYFSKNEFIIKFPPFHLLIT